MAAGLGFATELPSKKRPQPTKVAAAPPTAAAAPAPATMQAELDAALAGLQQQLAVAEAPADAMHNLPALVSAQMADQRTEARKLFGYLDQNPDRLVETLEPDNLLSLPVGISTRLGDNSRITLGVLSAETILRHRPPSPNLIVVSLPMAAWEWRWCFRGRCYLLPYSETNRTSEPTGRVSFAFSIEWLTQPFSGKCKFRQTLLYPRI
ncbi:MAG: hypothetical protein EAZ70_05720 [Runella slithyformis]|nr:MAG: hypothetical protein EAZ70_05720 [Runella slithyformis]